MRLNDVYNKTMSNPELTRIVRVKAYQDTLCSSPKYNGPLPQLLSYNYDSIYEPKPYINSDCKFNVINADTLNVAENLVSKGLNPLVLCFADDNIPGGFVSSGAGAQEEEIWRRTNISKALANQSDIYPLEWNELLLIRQVTVFKDTSYQKMETPFTVDILNAVALRSPSITNDEYTESLSYKLMDDKIGAIFKSAIHNENDSIVLGAFGCGSFSNPPKVIAELFRKHATIFNDKFKQITFAVLGINYPIFQNILSK